MGSMKNTPSDGDANKKKTAAFIERAAFGDIAGMARLRKAGVPVDAKGEDGWTALLIAIDDDRREVVEWLLKHGADKNLANKDGDTPAMCAAYSQSSVCLNLLVEAGCDLDRTRSNGRTALMVALSADPDERDFYFEARERCIEILFESGGGLAAVDCKGQRAEDIARDVGWVAWASRISTERERRELETIAKAVGGSRSVRLRV
jgi:ankyrin repeat protein